MPSTVSSGAGRSITVVHAVLNVSFRGTTWWTLAIPLLSMVAIVAALLYRRRDRRRVDIPVAERGRVSEEAIREVTGELPVVRPGDARADDPEAATELIAPGQAETPSGRHRAPGEDPLDAETEVIPPAESRRRPVVPLEPRSSRR